MTLLTAAEIAAELHVSRRTAYDWIRRMPGRVYIGRTVRVPRWALDRFLEAHTWRESTGDAYAAWAHWIAEQALSDAIAEAEKIGRGE